jgi:signal transduction histidine kinase
MNYREKKNNIIIVGIIIFFLIGILGYFVIFIEKKILGKMKNGKEGMSNSNIHDIDQINKEIEDMGLAPALGFCQANKTGKSREDGCNKLTKENCKMTSCCVYTNDKCVAGNKNGPLFKTKNGVEIKVDSFDHYGKCYGKNC